MAAVMEKPHARKIDLGIMVTLATLLAGAAIYIADAEIGDHDSNQHAHPQITQQVNANSGALKRIEANQLREQAIQMDARLCDDPDNRVYRAELSRLITAWEGLTGKSFPRELLSCTR